MLNHVAERFDLTRDIQFETRVTGAIFDDTTNRWTIRTDRGDRISAQVLRHGDGLLIYREGSRFQGARDISGTQVSHWALAP